MEEITSTILPNKCSSYLSRLGRYTYRDILKQITQFDAQQVKFTLPSQAKVDVTKDEDTIIKFEVSGIEQDAHYRRNRLAQIMTEFEEMDDPKILIINPKNSNLPNKATKRQKKGRKSPIFDVISRNKWKKLFIPKARGIPGVGRYSPRYSSLQKHSASTLWSIVDRNTDLNSPRFSPIPISPSPKFRSLSITKNLQGASKNAGELSFCPSPSNLSNLPIFSHHTNKISELIGNSQLVLNQRSKQKFNKSMDAKDSSSSLLKDLLPKTDKFIGPIPEKVKTHIPEIDFKRNMGREREIVVNLDVNEKRFSSYLQLPAISTKHKKITVDFRMSKQAPRLSPSPPLRAQSEYDPNFSVIRKRVPGYVKFDVPRRSKAENERNEVMNLLVRYKPHNYWKVQA